MNLPLHGTRVLDLTNIVAGPLGSYQLALMAARHPEKKVIIESAVHFMAESISILANPDQNVYITKLFTKIKTN